jgi:hypothetical protein
MIAKLIEQRDYHSCKNQLRKHKNYKNKSLTFNNP